MKNLFVKIQSYYAASPFGFILIAGILIRLVAVIFSRGFGMHDDHFVFVECPASFVDGYDYNNWLPSSHPVHPGGHSWFYPGFMYIILYILKMLHISDPQTKMLLVRFIHAAFSMITVIYGYKITKKLADLSTANIVGWLLALFWFLPFFSVRNLVEIFSIPFMIYAVWFIVRKDGRLLNYLIAGIIMSLAVSVRFQCAFFVSGFALGILITKKWKEFLLFSAGAIFSFIAVQGTIDYFIWGKPFTEFMEYVRYNMVNANSFVNNPWYSYLLLLLGILLPPVSFMLFWGYFYSWKKYWPAFAGIFFFILFHCLFPNKQERFILPVVPFLIIFGMIGWKSFAGKSKFWNRHRKLIKAGWIFFWCINLLLLPVISTTYSKRARVEAMVYLSKYDNIKLIAVEETNKGKTDMLPVFYLGQWDVDFYELKTDSTIGALRDYLLERDTASIADSSLQPRFVLFYGDKDLQPRTDSVIAFLPGLVYETTISPGFIDDLLYRMNPRNANTTIYIYRNSRLIPKQK